MPTHPRRSANFVVGLFREAAQLPELSREGASATPARDKRRRAYPFISSFGCREH